MQSFILALAILLQTAPSSVPSISLHVPEQPVGFARSVRMRIDTPLQGTPPNDWTTYAVEWDVTERTVSDNPLENDLDVDSNSLKASVPSGLDPTSLKVKVVVTFIYKDGSTRVARDTKYVTISAATSPVVVKPQPQPGPPPGPGPVNPPVPGPVPVVPPAPLPPPLPPPEQFGLTTWTKAQLWSNPLPVAQAKALAGGFHSIATEAKNGVFITKEDTVAAMKACNIAVLGTNITPWIDSFFKPLQAQLNPMNPRIKTIADQATLFDEIGNGLDAYVNGIK